MNIFLNSYYPINSTAYGRTTLKKYPETHPLEDGSIRREPDFKSSFPGISGLCRPGKMNENKLKKDDIILYKTNRTHYLTAILKVVKRLETHQEAKEWFEAKGIEVPSNCILMDHLPLEKSHAKHNINPIYILNKDNKFISMIWESAYKERANDPKSSYFFITESIYNVVKDKKNDFLKIDSVLRKHSKDGKVNNTSFSPQELSKECYDEILNLI